MSNQSKHTNWNEKYRPIRLEDAILPSFLKRQFMGMRDGEKSLCLAFYGDAGTGKTTTAKLFNPDTTTVYNCATQCKMEDIILLERQFTSHAVSGGKRVIVLDEADNLKPAIQSALKGIVERCAASTMFILTTNNIEKLSKPLLSRFTEFDFSIDKADVQLRGEFKNRVMQILSYEGVTPDNFTIDSIIRKHFPDMRKALGQLQFNYGLASTTH